MYLCYESHFDKVVFNYIILLWFNPLSMKLFMEERWRNMFDVTKGLTVRQGVLLYCDILLWNMTMMNDV
jgi:hypothetical protein